MAFRAPISTTPSPTDALAQKLKGGTVTRGAVRSGDEGRLAVL